MPKTKDKDRDKDKEKKKAKKLARKAKKALKKALKKEEGASEEKPSKKTKKKKKKDTKKLKKSKKIDRILKGSTAKEYLAAGFCPCCDKHCPLSAPKCSKGKMVASKLGVSVAKASKKKKTEGSEHQNETRIVENHETQNR